MSFIKVVDLKKNYITSTEVVNALNGVSFELERGEIISLLGPNGAGKTTLSSLLATVHPPSSGEILWENSSIYTVLASYRRIIGFCPQAANLDMHLSVYDNLYFACRYYKPNLISAKAHVDKLIERFNLGQYRDASIQVLSGGYRQRVLIARALVHEPELLILDEPTIALDPHIRHQLWEEIRGLKKQGLTIVLTTHYLDEAEALSDRVCIIDKGRIKVIETPERLKEHYKKGRLEDVFLQIMQENSSQV